MTRRDVRHTHRREEALLDNFQLVRYLQEDAWIPNEEPTELAYIQAAEKRGLTTELLANQERGEHMEVFWGIYSHTMAMVALIHSDHTGVRLIPTEER